MNKIDRVQLFSEISKNLAGVEVRLEKVNELAKAAGLDKTTPIPNLIVNIQKERQEILELLQSPNI
jgi:hypothetical protein